MGEWKSGRVGEWGKRGVGEMREWGKRGVGEAWCGGDEGDEGDEGGITHSPFAIRHSPFAIRHSPFAIRHSPFFKNNRRSAYDGKQMHPI